MFLSLYIRRREINFKLLKDETNGIEYELTEPTAIYLVWYLKKNI